MKITIDLFLLGLLITSTITSLTTEGVKKILNEHNKKYSANTLVGIIAVIISVVISAGYILITKVEFDAEIIAYAIGLIFFSWLSAMLGYDKVIETIGQFRRKNTD